MLFNLLWGFSLFNDPRLIHLNVALICTFIAGIIKKKLNIKFRAFQTGFMESLLTFQDPLTER